MLRLKNPHGKKLFFLTKTIPRISIFGLFLKLRFSGLKRFLFYLQYKKLSHFWLKWPKTHMIESSILGQKLWTNAFENCYFLDLFETSLFCSKKYSFLSRILKNDLFCLGLPKKPAWEKPLLIFWQKPWTNPFEKFDFFNLFETPLFWSKIYSFLSRIFKSDLFFLGLPKKHTW